MVEDLLTKQSERLHSITQEQWDLAHLQLRESVDTAITPFTNVTDYYIAHPEEHLLSIMMNPDYFGWTCSKIFNTSVSEYGLELLPTQCATLREMWQRPFPMLIATRGWGKSFILALYMMLRALLIQGRKIIITGAGFRQSKIVFGYAELLWYNSPIFRDLCGASSGKSQGPHHDTDQWSMQVGESIIKAVPLGDGCNSFGTKTLRQNGFSTIEEDSKYLVYGDGKFRDSDEHYINGLRPTKKVVTKRGYSYETTYNHRMKMIRSGTVDWVRTDEVTIGDRILIDRSYRWHSGDSGITEDQAYSAGCQVWPKESYAINRSFPDKILKSPRNVTAVFISGLFDTNGTTYRVGHDVTISFYNISEKLIDQLQFILLHFGIISTKTNHAKAYELLITGSDVVKFDREIGFKLERKNVLLKSSLANESQDSSTNDISNPDIYHDEIVSIENSESLTFDIHVPDGHEYCANGFFSHNSKIRGQRAHDIIADEFGCVGPNTIVETDKGLVRIIDLMGEEFRVFTGNNNDLERPAKFIITPPTQAFKITTVGGYEFICSGKHEVCTVDGWKLAKDLTIDDQLPFPDTYIFPANEISGLDRYAAYRLGTMSHEYIPSDILASPKHIVLAFLDALYSESGLIYRHESKRFCQELQILLSKLGLFSTLSKDVQWTVTLDIDTFEHVNIESVEPITEPMVLYDFHLPTSHSFVGNCFRQHNSIPQQIFEEVVAGFGVVNLDPISQVKHYQRMEYLKEMNDPAAPSKIDESTGIVGNQIIISGTATFAFNHFYAYWKKQHDIITSKGDPARMKNLGLDPTLEYEKYSIFRIPVDLLPRGFMDETHVQRSRATVSVGIYANEFGAVFSADSAGFFKRSILDGSMPSARNPIILPNGETSTGFNALLSGDRDKKYIMAVDTASERDKFAIVILETYDDHARIVYCWTTDRQEHIEQRNHGTVLEKDFYAFTMRKIRNLMKAFNIIHIAIDSQGGGRTISELLHNETHLEPNEQLIWELNSTSPLWNNKSQESDDERGLHILEMCHFADSKYISDANHGMKNDFEQRLLLFPYFDAVEVVVANAQDRDSGRTIDTLDDTIAEIDALKDELQTIDHSPTASGREHWGVPKLKDSGEVGRLYDDRYAALLMANSAARRLRQIPILEQPYYIGGGFAGQLHRDNDPEHQVKLYTGPAWFTGKSTAEACYGMVVKK